MAPIREQLQRGEAVADAVFDAVYPDWARRVSSTHWTPVRIALRAAALLAPRPGARLLDVGSGVGKFCIVAAAAFGARVRGVEHRAHFVGIAEDAAERLGVDVSFIRGTLADCDPREVDGVYLYNPFAENLCISDDQLDQSVELSEARFERDVVATEDFLRDARVGTRIVTYCGFGGELAPAYARIFRESRDGTVELWVKTEDGVDRVDAPSSGTRLAPPPASSDPE